MQPIKGFGVETLDEGGYEIEESGGVYSMQTDVASTFVYNPNLTPQQLSEMVISTGDYKVGATGQAYKFTFYTLGAIPMGARMDLVFPAAGWKLDCVNTASWPKVVCDSTWDKSHCRCTQAGMKCDAARNMF